MNRNTLFFITAEFPYGKGETYIESEIHFLAEAFDNIVIIPLKASATARAIPDNVSVAKFDMPRADWLKVLIKFGTEASLCREFLQNLFSPPIRNKVLLRSVANALSISDFLQHLRDKSPSGEVIFYSYWLDDSALAIAFMKEANAKVSRAHRWDVYLENNPGNYLPLRKYLASKLDRIFSVSDDGRLYLAMKTSAPTKFKTSRLGTLNESLINISQTEMHLNVISISNVTLLKRISLIGESVKLMEEVVKWHHFGDGPLLPQMQRDFPTAIFHGHIGNHELKEIIKELAPTSILLNTSSSEGLPVSMMEALSFGIPCIGTEVGGVAEIIEDGVNGFLLPANPTPNEIAACLKKYLNLSPREKANFRLRARSVWEAKFDANKNYTDFINELKSLGIS